MNRTAATRPPAVGGLFRSNPRRFSVLSLQTLCLCGFLALMTGCENSNLDARLDAGVQKLFAPRRSPQQYFLLATSSEDADVRRDAVSRISRSKQYSEEWAIKGYIAIACLESDPQTRCVAIRALARTGDPRAADTLLKILNHETISPEEIWPPTPLVRWDATAALADLATAGQIPEEQREAARKTFLARLNLDPERHTRIAAARGLANFSSDETLRALVNGLHDPEYAVVHECENSLVKLTGVTHNGNAGAWEDWLAANTATPFAHAGEVPASRRPPYNNNFEKSWYETRETLRWLWPGKKEE